MLVARTPDAVPQLPDDLWLIILKKVAEMGAGHAPIELLQLMPTCRSFQQLIVELTSREITLSLRPFKLVVSGLDLHHHPSLQQLIP